MKNIENNPSKYFLTSIGVVALAAFLLVGAFTAPIIKDTIKFFTAFTGDEIILALFSPLLIAVVVTICYYIGKLVYEKLFRD